MKNYIDERCASQKCYRNCINFITNYELRINDGEISCNKQYTFTRKAGAAYSTEIWANRQNGMQHIPACHESFIHCSW